MRDSRENESDSAHLFFILFFFFVGIDLLSLFSHSLQVCPLLYSLFVINSVPLYYHTPTTQFMRPAAWPSGSRLWAKISGRGEVTRLFFSTETYIYIRWPQYLRGSAGGNRGARLNQFTKVQGLHSLDDIKFVVDNMVSSSVSWFVFFSQMKRRRREESLVHSYYGWIKGPEKPVVHIRLARAPMKETPKYGYRKKK